MWPLRLKQTDYYKAELASTGGSTSDEFVCYTPFKNRINTTCELFNMRVEDMKTCGATHSQKSEKNGVTPRLHTIVLDSGSRLPTRPNNNVVLRTHMTTDPLNDGLSLQPRPPVVIPRPFDGIPRPLVVIEMGSSLYIAEILLWVN